MGANDPTHFNLAYALSGQHKIALMVFNFISSLINIFSNAFLLYTVRKLKLGTRVSYRFVVALAISELVVGATIQPLFSVVYADTFASKFHATTLHVAVEATAVVPVQFSTLMILLISVDRYLHMKHLNLYNVYMTRRRGNILIICSVFVSILLGILSILASLYEFYIPVSIGVISTDAIVFSALMICYIKAYLSVRKRVAATEVLNGTAKGISRVDMQFAKAILVIMASLALRYIPYYIFAFLVAKESSLQNGIIFAHFWSTQLLFLGACTNVVILFGFNRKLRNFLSLRIRCRRPMDEE